jgi:hypothetical protein
MGMLFRAASFVDRLTTSACGPAPMAEQGNFTGTAGLVFEYMFE